MSTETFFIDCPHCHARIEVSKKSGKVVQSWEKLEKKEGVDQLSAALQKRKEEKARLDKYFSGAPGSLKAHKEELLGRFEAEKKKVQESGPVERPENPFDLD